MPSPRAGRIALLTCCAVWVVASAGILAHNEYRIIGTVTSITAKRLEVKQTKDGKVISMEIDDQSVVTRDKKTVGRAEITVGGRVVVDACGDDLEHLLVVEVRLFPPLPARP